MPPTNLFGLGYGVGPAGYGYPSAGSPWSPLSLGSSPFWDASDLRTLWQDTGKTVPAVADGDPVRVIADKSANGYDLVAPSDAARGTLKLNILNGRSVVRLNGTDQYYDVSIPAYTGTTYSVGGLVIYRGNSAATNPTVFATWESTGSLDSLANTETLDVAMFDLFPKGFRAGARVASAYHSMRAGVPSGFLSVFDGTNHKVYGDKGLANTVASTGAFGFNRIRVGAIMFGGGPLWFGQHDIGELYAAQSALTLADANLLDAYLQSKWGNWTASQVICEGDSLTYGIGASPITSYPSQMQDLFATTRIHANLGTGGKTLATMLTDYPTRVAPFYNANRTKNVVSLFAGINDNGRSAAAVYADTQAYVALAQATGFKIVVHTLLPHVTPAVEAFRVAFNTLLRADAAGADGLSDIAADSRIGDPGDNTDLTYYDADQVHMNATGYGVVAAITKTAIEALP